jgi:ATP-dependent protease HslVU (ClpYQ) ATPase subunit
MQLFFGKPKSPLAFVAAISASLFYAGGAFNTAAAPKVEPRVVGMAPIKVENISIDYSQAHANLMKKPDEVTVDVF